MSLPKPRPQDASGLAVALAHVLYETLPGGYNWHTIARLIIDLRYARAVKISVVTSGWCMLDLASTVDAAHALRRQQLVVGDVTVADWNWRLVKYSDGTVRHSGGPRDNHSELLKMFGLKVRRPSWPRGK